jgi:Ni2+-binding GTPase involved in maturation of urease and hydrogenase
MGGGLGDSLDTGRKWRMTIVIKGPLSEGKTKALDRSLTALVKKYKGRVVSSSPKRKRPR